MLKRRRRGPIYYNLPEPNLSSSAWRTLTAAAIIILIIVTAGLVYVKQTDENSSPVASQTVKPTADSFQIFKPIKPAANTAESASVETFTSLAKPGGQASLSVKTKPDSTCTIEILYNNTPAHEGGMQPAKADDYGTVSWSWTVSPAAPIGMWPINVTCASEHKTAFLQTNLEVDN